MRSDSAPRSDESESPSDTAPYRIAVSIPHELLTGLEGWTARHQRLIRKRKTAYHHDTTWSVKDEIVMLLATFVAIESPAAPFWMGKVEFSTGREMSEEEPAMTSDSAPRSDECESRSDTTPYRIAVYLPFKLLAGLEEWTALQQRLIREGRTAYHRDTTWTVKDEIVMLLATFVSIESPDSPFWMCKVEELLANSVD